MIIEFNIKDNKYTFNNNHSVFINDKEQNIDVPYYGGNGKILILNDYDYTTLRYDADSLKDIMDIGLKINDKVTSIDKLLKISIHLMIDSGYDGGDLDLDGNFIYVKKTTKTDYTLCALILNDK